MISNLIADQTANNPAALDRRPRGPICISRTLRAHRLHECRRFVEPHGAGPPTRPSIRPGRSICQSAILPTTRRSSRRSTRSGNLFIPNVTPDAGLSAPFNSWFTFFGQFFDHGLDLVTKGGSGTVFIPLQPDDPLITVGPDGIAGTGDEVTNPACSSWC